METLRRGWRGMLYWGLGVALFAWTITIIIPNMETLKQFENLINTMPAVIKMLGMEEAAQVATPEGFISAAYFGRVLLILAIYAVLAGLNVTANEEDAGIMDVLLSLPLPRWRLIVEKFAAYSLMSVVIVALGFIGLVIGTGSSALRVEPVKLLVGSLNILPALLFMMALTLLAGALLRRKVQAAGVAAGIIIVSYLLDFIASAASGSVLANLRVVSFFTYYDNAHILQTGLQAANVALLLGLTALCVVGAVWAFQRRDIGV